MKVMFAQKKLGGIDEESEAFMWQQDLKSGTGRKRLGTGLRNMIVK